MSSIFLATLVTGMFFGPWIALSKSISTFKPEIFLAIVDRLNRNMAPVMTILMPAALLSIVPILILSYHKQSRVFYLVLAGFTMFLGALLVTVLVEVPIVKQIVTWTVSTLPANWQQLRNRWSRFHLVRIIAAATGLALLLIVAIF